MTPFVETVSRCAVIGFYAATFAMALWAHWNTRIWARKLATVGMMAIAAGWLAFYLANSHNASTSSVVLWSRVFHYNTATWLFIMAFVIRRSDKYGLAETFHSGPHE